MAVTTVKIDGTKITEYLEQSGMDRTSFISADHKGQKLDPKTLRKAIAGEPIAVEVAKLLADKADISAEELVLPEFVEMVAEEAIHISNTFYTKPVRLRTEYLRLQPIETAESLTRILVKGTKPLSTDYWEGLYLRPGFSSDSIKVRPIWKIHEDVEDQAELLKDLTDLHSGIEKHNKSFETDTSLGHLIQQIQCTEEINTTLGNLNKKGVRLFGGLAYTDEEVQEGHDIDGEPIMDLRSFTNVILMFAPDKYKSVKVSYNTNSAPVMEWTDEEREEFSKNIEAMIAKHDMENGHE